MRRDADTAMHPWTDVNHWLAELRREPPTDLALAAWLWRRAVALQWLTAAGARLSCTDGRVVLPPSLEDCPARKTLVHLARELEREGGP